MLMYCLWRVAFLDASIHWRISWFTTIESLASMPLTNAIVPLCDKPEHELKQEIDEHIRNCSLAISLRAHLNFTESRPLLSIPDHLHESHLVKGMLSGPSGIAVIPYEFSEPDGSSLDTNPLHGGGRVWAPWFSSRQLYCNYTRRIHRAVRFMFCPPKSAWQQIADWLPKPVTVG
jgi:hypothetical protein